MSVGDEKLINRLSVDKVLIEQASPRTKPEKKN